VAETKTLSVFVPMAARGRAGWAASCLPSRLRSPGGRSVPSADDVDAEEESRTPTSADNAKGHESFSDESPAQQTSQEAWPSHGDPEFLLSEAGTPDLRKRVRLTFGGGYA